MKLSLRILLSLSMMLLILLGGAVLASNSLIKMYSNEIKQYLSELLKGEVEFAAISLHFFPGAHVELRQVRVGARAAPLVEAEALSLSLALRPLLSSGELRLDTQFIEPTVYYDVLQKSLGEGGAFARNPTKHALNSNPVPSRLYPRLLLGRILLQRARLAFYGQDKKSTYFDITTKLHVADDRWSLITPHVDLTYLATTFAISADTLEATRGEGAFLARNLVFRVRDQIARIDGSWSEARGSADIQLQRINSESLQLLANLVADFLGGRIDLPVSFRQLNGVGRFKRKEGQNLLTIDSLVAREAALMRSGVRATAARYSMERTKLSFTSLSDVQLSTRYSITNLQVRSEEREYGTEQSSGELIISPKHPKGEVLSASSKVKGFLYRDSATAISKVDADLPRIQAKMSRQGDLSVRLRLEGGPIDLDHQAITIRGAAKVSSELEIAVPAKGGYSVAGPVEANDAKIKLFDRQLDSASGRVAIFISTQRRRFTTENLQIARNQRQAVLRADFVMLQDLYRLVAADLSLGGGTIRANGVMERLGKQTVTLSTEASRIDLAQAGPLFLDASSEYQGMLERLTFKAHTTSPQLLPGAIGKGEFVFRQKLSRNRDFNRLLGDAIRAIPLLSKTIPDSWFHVDPQRQSMSGNFVLRDGVVQLTKVRMQVPSYTVEGRGELTFSGNLNMAARVIFLRETLRAIPSPLTITRKLFGLGGQLSVPITVKGTIPDVSVRPDLAEFAKMYSGLGILEKALP